jgi:16S rRNA (cytidine1402-2'-O)-methyltransferase
LSGSFPSGKRGILYVVATPIGNPEDITARAVRALAEVDLIACEDTRRTGRILAAHSIRTPTVSYFEHNEERRTRALVERLRMGAQIAIVTDAGTPAISDPGYRLVRAAIEAGIRVTPIPGPSAVIAALSIAGLPTDRFVFEGFLPSKAGERRRALERLAREERTLVFYEASRRLAETLTDMATAFGGDRIAVVVREMTKTYEETVRGSFTELANRFASQEVLGEVTLVVEGARPGRQAGVSPSHADESRMVEVLCEAGLSLKQAAAAVAKLTGASRRDVYQLALRSRRGEE